MIYQGDESIEIDELLDEFEEKNGGPLVPQAMSPGSAKKSTARSRSEASTPQTNRMLSYSGKGPTMGSPMLSPLSTATSQKNHYGLDDGVDEEWELAKREASTRLTARASGSKPAVAAIPGVPRVGASTSGSRLGMSQGTLTSRSWTTNPSVK
jgi:hypothetical protein